MTDIRKAGPGDVNMIRDVAWPSWLDTYIPIVGKDQVDYMFERFYSEAAIAQQMEEGQVFLLSTANGVCCGFASYTMLNDEQAKLNKLYVLPETKGKGVGKALLDNVSAKVADTGRSVLLLNVNKYNYAAQEFYKRYGFSLLHEEVIDIGSGYVMDDYVLHKRL